MNKFEYNHDFRITELFPVPLFQTVIDIPDINKDDWVWKDNLNNQISENQKILEHESLSILKKDIELNLNTFWRNVLNADCEADIEITHSWLNITHTHQSHHLHRHPNSYISGVLFWQHHESAIVFSNDRYSQIQYEVSCTNMLNSNTWRVCPEPGLLLLFPSYQSHAVEYVSQEQSERLSLSFDTWVRGSVNSIPNQQLIIG